MLSALGALALARGMVRPIRTLEEGAQRIGAGDLDQRIDIRSGDELEALADQFNRMSGQLRESYAGLERKVDERTHELQNALEQQTAMSDILRVISRSPTDVQPVFDTIASAALSLCDAVSALVFTFDGNLIHLAANANVNPEDEQAWRQAFPRPPSRETATARAILTGRVVMIPDVLEDPEYAVGAMAVRTGFRSALAVPLIRDDKPIGAIGVGRPESGPFSDHQIAILQTFADQAVIAIENVRLFNETKEALERQTATAEVLKVISGSPTNLQPVFDSIAERAAVLSAANYVYVTTFDGQLIHMRAAYGPGAEAHRKHYPIKPSIGTVAGRVVLTQTSIEIPDMLADPAYAQKESAVEIGFRSALGVPMIREGHIVGCIV
ncbi:MAG: GAF domain-containing protein, partial [Bradyrhizobium sp.]